MPIKSILKQPKGLSSSVPHSARFSLDSMDNKTERSTKKRSQKSNSSSPQKFDKANFYKKRQGEVVYEYEEEEKIEVDMQ